MVRIYLDTNVLAALKSSHVSVYNKLLKIERDVLVVASEIHLVDLDSSDKQDLVAEDVQLLANLSKGNMLHLHEGGVHYFSDDVWSLYEQHTPLDSDAINEVLESVLAIDVPEYSDPTPLTDIERESYKIYEELIPGVGSCGTMGEVLKLVIPYSMNLFADPEQFRNYLKSVRKTEMNLSGISGNWQANEVFHQISSQYKVYFKNRNYREVMNSIVPEGGKGSRKLYPEFERDYMNLEVIGIASDKVKKKGLSMQNLISDIKHSYLASHCDILCTNDKNMKRKMEILTNEYGYKCDVLTINELDDYLVKMVHHLEDKTFESLIVELLHALSTFKNPLEKFEDGYRFVTINLDFYFVVYFNVCSFGYDADNQLAFILLTRREYSLSTNTFRAEILNLIKRIGSISDEVQQTLEFMEYEEVAENMKTGIHFLGGKFEFTLKLDENEVNPYLIICQIK